MTQNIPRTPSIVLTTLAAMVAAYYLPPVVSILLLFFAGTVLGVALDAIVTSADRWLPGGRGVGVLAMVIIVGLTAAGLAWVIVPPLIAQGPDLVRNLPAAWETLLGRLENHALLRPFREQIGAPSQWIEGTGLLGRVRDVLSGTFDIVFNVFVVVFIGIYLAVAPERYSHIVLYPLRAQRRQEVRELLAELGRELRFWLAGRAISMITVGILTGVGLWLLGIPWAFTLALIAGLLSFIPYLGPVLALVPALLIAFANSAAMTLSVVLLYTFIQILESYVVTPLIHDRTSAIPPALLLTVQLLGGVFGGVLGVLLAAPLAVVAATTFRLMYARPDTAEMAESA
jgi:predicted PurR-regulated permease PerM